jgi:hypothetical protein
VSVTYRWDDLCPRKLPESLLRRHSRANAGDIMWNPYGSSRNCFLDEQRCWTPYEQKQLSEGGYRSSGRTHIASRRWPSSVIRVLTPFSNWPTLWINVSRRCKICTPLSTTGKFYIRAKFTPRDAETWEIVFMSFDIWSLVASYPGPWSHVILY